MASFLTVHISDDEENTIRCSRRLSRPTSFRSDAGYQPSSPTDSLLSPCTKRLWGPKRMHSPDMTKEFKRCTSNLDLCVVPMPFPYPDVDLILGTSSMHRKAVIDKLGWQYMQLSPDIDEKAIRDDDPLNLPLLIAKAKAEALLTQLSSASTPSEKPRIVITADQVVLFERTIREKPVDTEQAKTFLSSYSEKSVSTVSAVVVTHYPSKIQAAGIDIATVFWDKISEEVVSKVVAKGRTMTCAGGFQVEDEDLSPLIKNIDGRIDSVMGMPVQLTVNLMEEVMAQQLSSTNT